MSFGTLSKDFLIEGSINNLLTIILINIEQIKKYQIVKMKKYLKSKNAKKSFKINNKKYKYYIKEFPILRSEKDNEKLTPKGYLIKKIVNKNRK